MRRFTYTKDCRLPALEDQLRAAGINPQVVEGHYPVGGVAPPGAILSFADADPVTRAQVDAVVAAHDPAALDLRAAQDSSRLSQAKLVLRAFVLNSAPTSADTAAAVKALIVAVRALAQVDN